LREGSDEAAQIVSFNGVLASQTVTEVLHLVTGFAVRKRIPQVLHYDGIEGTMKPIIVSRKVDCKNCSDELGHGDATW